LIDLKYLSTVEEILKNSSKKKKKSFKQRLLHKKPKLNKYKTTISKNKRAEKTKIEHIM